MTAEVQTYKMASGKVMFVENVRQHRDHIKIAFGLPILKKWKLVVQRVKFLCGRNAFSR